MKVKLFLTVLFIVLVSFSVLGAVTTNSDYKKEQDLEMDYDSSGSRSYYSYDHRDFEKPREIYTSYKSAKYDRDNYCSDNYCNKRNRYYDEYCNGNSCYYRHCYGSKCYTHTYHRRSFRCYTNCYYDYDRDFNRFYYWFEDKVQSTYSYSPSYSYSNYEYRWDGVSTY